MCVCTICIYVELHITAGGPWGTLQSAANEDAAMFLCKRTCLIYIYMYSPARGRIYVAAGGTYILSQLFYTVNVYCDYTSIYIYTCIIFHSSCHFIVGAFARKMHSTSEFAKIVLSKRVWFMLDSSRWHEPFGEYLSRSESESSTWHLSLQFST